MAWRGFGQALALQTGAHPLRSCFSSRGLSGKHPVLLLRQRVGAALPQSSAKILHTQAQCLSSFHIPVCPPAPRNGRASLAL